MQRSLSYLLESDSIALIPSCCHKDNKVSAISWIVKAHSNAFSHKWHWLELCTKVKKIIAISFHGLVCNSIFNWRIYGSFLAPFALEKGPSPVGQFSCVHRPNHTWTYHKDIFLLQNYMYEYPILMRLLCTLYVLMTSNEATTWLCPCMAISSPSECGGHAHTPPSLSYVQHSST